MADTYWDDSWGERLPFLEAVPEEKKEEKEGGLSAEEIEKLLDSITMGLYREEEE